MLTHLLRRTTHHHPNHLPVTRLFTTSSANDLQRTALYDDHVKLGGKMVPFANYSLPVQYTDSIVSSHLHCRNSASLFDVSHMGQLKLYGQKRAEFLETLVPSNVLELKDNHARLSSFTNPQGGIMDDCMITNKGNHLYLVVNAGCKDKDIQHIKHHMAQYNKQHNTDLSLEFFSDQHELIALQGPKAAVVLDKMIDRNLIDLKKTPFMYSHNTSIAGIKDCIVARCGYTGEDGFEISVPRQHVSQLWHTLLDANSGDVVKAAGLGVRDSLRLEAGLCLYGHDMTDETTPIEAGLKFTIQKRRREQGGFLGADVIQKQLRDGPEITRVGFTVLKGPPARENAEILLADSGEKIGTVTSGTQSPVLNKAIGMGYVKTAHSADDTKIKVVVRGKQYDAVITKMPFVAAKYYRVPVPPAM